MILRQRKLVVVHMRERERELEESRATENNNFHLREEVAHNYKALWSETGN